MANGKIIFGKQSGGQLTLVIPDGVSNTEVVVPESGVLATQAYADGKTTLTQVKAEISTGSNLVTSSTGAVGYGTGAGGTVTQLTSKSTTVTLNKPTGQITMNNASLATNTWVGFSVINSLVTPSDIIIVNVVLGSTVINLYEVKARPQSGSIAIDIRHSYPSSLTDEIVIKFTVLKGANS